MKQQLGWWFPDSETHLPEWMRSARQMRGNVHQYQYAKYLAALPFVRPTRALAVDVGAHIGLWSRNMAMDFKRVRAFEPVPVYAECWRENMSGISNVVLHEVALGASAGVVNLTCATPGSNGDTRIAPAGASNVVASGVPMIAMDNFLFEEMDLLKIDCEGYELFVVRGGERTIKQCRPCVIVEQKPGHAQQFDVGETAAVDLLRSWGAKLREVIAGDYILSWD